MSIIADKAHVGNPVGVQENTTVAVLLDRINNKQITTAIVGLGYVGLPFLVEKAKVNLNVIGIDKSLPRVKQLLQGISYIDDVASEELRFLLDKRLINASDSMSAASEADVIVICVPTPLDKNRCPDLSHVRSVSEDLVPYLRKGQLVSLESTTYPGTTEEVIQPILEKSGLVAGKDFFLAHSPERVDPGNQRYTTKNTNKVVGAINQASLDVAKAFYELAIEHVVPVSSCKIAEMVKVFENTYRAVNIALVNELALLCDKMDINVWEMLEAAFTKPFGIMPFYPGPGVGGHCIPIDPHYLEWKAKEYNFQTRFISLASEINIQMHDFVFRKATRLLNAVQKSVNGSKILLIGMAYKSDISDGRESPATEILRKLLEAGAQVSYHDSYIPSTLIDGKQFSSVKLTEATLTGIDLAIIITLHSDLDCQWLINKAPLVLDTRNATKDCLKRDNVVLL